MRVRTRIRRKRISCMAHLPEATPGLEQGQAGGKGHRKPPRSIKEDVGSRSSQQVPESLTLGVNGVYQVKGGTT